MFGSRGSCLELDVLVRVVCSVIGSAGIECNAMFAVVVRS